MCTTSHLATSAATLLRSPGAMPRICPCGPHSQQRCMSSRIVWTGKARSRVRSTREASARQITPCVGCWASHAASDAGVGHTNEGPELFDCCWVLRGRSELELVPIGPYIDAMDPDLLDVCHGDRSPRLAALSHLVSPVRAPDQIWQVVLHKQLVSPHDLNSTMSHAPIGPAFTCMKRS